ncbi:FecR family protein [Methylomonas sp. EFPC1]|nr:FecR family protein [Methylomonas sp. EFPC1]
MASSSASDRIFTEANAWFFRLRADDVGTAEREQFAAWLAASPLHAEAWDTVQALFADLEAPAKAVRRQAEAPLAANSATTTKRPRRRRTASIAAAVAACVGLIAVLLQPALVQNLQSDYHTATGEQRLVTLTDGSRLLLNTDSAVDIEMTAAQRRVTLLRGEAFFEVTRAPQRPFWVVAGDARARVTGTAFSVGRRSEDVAVTVAEGRVETSTESHPEQITPLTPGESAHYRGARLSAKQTADVPRELAWRQGQMVFVQAPLAEVVAQINRYRPGRLIITDRQLENRPITAVFNIGKLDDAVSALEQTFGIRARRIADYWVLLG